MERVFLLLFWVFSIHSQQFLQPFGVSDFMAPTFDSTFKKFIQISELYMVEDIGNFIFKWQKK